MWGKDYENGQIFPAQWGKWLRPMSIKTVHFDLIQTACDVVFSCSVIVKSALTETFNSV